MKDGILHILIGTLAMLGVLFPLWVAAAFLLPRFGPHILIFFLVLAFVIPTKK